MFYADEDDPYGQYGQQSLPYQPYREYAGSPQPRQQLPRVVSPPAPAPHVDSPYMLPARSRQQMTDAPRPSSRMSKGEALAFVRTCKRWLVAGSVVAFAVLSGLVAGHVTGATSSQAAPASNAPATSPSSGGGYFQQQQQGGGSNFGNGNPFQPPVSGSHTS